MLGVSKLSSATYGIALMLTVQVKGEIDDDYSVMVEFWVHYAFDRRIGIFHGDLLQGVDMKMIPGTGKVVDGEARLYVLGIGQYNILVFEAYGSVHVSNGPGRAFPPFKKQIKRWRAGDLRSIQDVPNNSGVPTLSNNAGVDTSSSVE